MKGLCALCRLTDLKTDYMLSKLEKYNNFELDHEIKTLTKKMGDVTDSEDFSDNISKMDDSEDENFIPPKHENQTYNKKEIV